MRSERAWHRGRSLSLQCAILGLVMIPCGCTAVAPRTYLDHAVGRQTQQQVEARLGPPLMQVPADRGATIWIYRYAGVRAEGPAAIEQLWCYEHALTFGRDKVLKDWHRQDCLQSHAMP